METTQEKMSRRQEQRKKQSLLKTISSFTVTSVVAVAAFLLPADPTAVLRVESVGNGIYYEVEVQDPENSLVEGSLEIIVSGDDGELKQSIPIGKSSGSFFDLDAESEYTIQVSGNQGFGKKIYTSQTIITNAGLGGIILQTALQTERDPSLHMQMLEYLVTVLINDPNLECANLLLRYAYLYLYEMEETPVPEESDYTTIVLDKNNPVTLISDIPDQNVMLFLSLEAELLSGDVVILSNKQFPTPVKLQCSLYQTVSMPNEIEVNFYGDYQVVSDVRYLLHLYQDTTLIQTTDVPKNSSGDEWSEQVFRYTGLIPDSRYHIEVVAVYPDTGSGEMITMTISDIDVMTSKEYSVEITVTDLGTFYSADIVLNDPSAIVENVQYYIFSVSAEGYRTFVESGTIILSPLPSGAEGAMVELMKPATDHYEIVISGDIIISETETIFGSVFKTIEQ